MYVCVYMYIHCYIGISLYMTSFYTLIFKWTLRLCGFHILAIVNNATVNIGLPVSFQLLIYLFLILDTYQEVRLLDHIVALFFVF